MAGVVEGLVLNRGMYLSPGSHHVDKGSPQLDYKIHICLGEPDAEMTNRARSSVHFGLRISGGELCVRDGYDPTEWEFDQEGVVKTSLEDGYYAVGALWIPDSSFDGMQIMLYLKESESSVPGDGWPDLEYIVE